MFLSLSKIEALQERTGAVFALFTYVSQCLVPYDNITGKKAKVLYGYKIDISVLYHFICFCWFFFFLVFSSKVWFTGKNGICNFEGLTLFSFGYIFLLQ